MAVSYPMPLPKSLRNVIPGAGSLFALSAASAVAFSACGTSDTTGLPPAQALGAPEGGASAPAGDGAAGASSGDARAPVDGGGAEAAIPGDAGGGDASRSDSAGGAAPSSPNLLVGYYQTWSDTWQSTGANTALARLPSYLDVVNLAFMEPNTTYAPGTLSLGGTGIGVPYDGPTLKAAIAALHASHPATRVMISVGGATYSGWSTFAPQAIATFVSDFGLDGADLDYEPSNPDCSSAGGTVACPSSDAQYVSVVRSMRAAMPAPKWLSIAAWHVGAYGEGAWASAPPTGSSYMGISLAVLKDSQASASIDLLNVMSYDAGPTYSPEQALEAYQHYFPGRIAMGVEVPPEAWGGHVETLAEIDSLATAVKSRGAAGLMLWSIQKSGPAQQFATRMCTDLALSDCTAPIM